MKNERLDWKMPVVTPPWHRLLNEFWLYSVKLLWCCVDVILPDQGNVSIPPNPWENKLQISLSFTVQQNYHNFHLEKDRDWRESSVLPQGVTGFVLVKVLWQRAHWKSPPRPRPPLYFVCIYHPFSSWPHVQPVGNSTQPLIWEFPTASPRPLIVVTITVFPPDLTLSNQSRSKHSLNDPGK